MNNYFFYKSQIKIDIFYIKNRLLEFHQKKKKDYKKSLIS